MGEGAQGTGNHSSQEPAMCLSKWDNPAPHITGCRQAVCRDRRSLYIGWRQPGGQYSGIREQKPAPFPAHDSVVCFM